MELNLEKVTLTSNNKQSVKEIYTSSFSKKDRMLFVLMLMMSTMKPTDFLAFRNGERVCGFVYMATIKKLTFIMFFAVDEPLRSQGIGSRILRQIQALYPENKIVLTIERCDEDVEDIALRRRRKKFYQSNGYREAGFLVKLGNQVQEIMIKNGTFDKREFTLFFLRYSNFTMKPKIWETVK